jgi:hypothetical protein
MNKMQKTAVYIGLAGISALAIAELAGCFRPPHNDYHHPNKDAGQVLDSQILANQNTIINQQSQILAGQAADAARDSELEATLNAIQNQWPNNIPYPTFPPQFPPTTVNTGKYLIGKKSYHITGPMLNQQWKGMSGIAKSEMMAIFGYQLNLEGLFNSTSSDGYMGWDGGIDVNNLTSIATVTFNSGIKGSANIQRSFIIDPLGFDLFERANLPIGLYGAVLDNAQIK